MQTWHNVMLQVPLSNPITGLDKPNGFQEAVAPRF